MKKEKEKIAFTFVGHCGEGSNALSLLKGFQSIVQDVDVIDTQIFDSPGKFTIRRIVKKLFPNAYGAIVSKIIHIKLLNSRRRYSPEILFVFKGNYVGRGTLLRFDSLKIHYHPDDSTNEVNRTSVFNTAEAFYDIHFTSKRHNLSEIYQRTEKTVYFIWYAYDADWHYKLSPEAFKNHKFKVGFIGHMRPDRINLVLQLAEKYGRDFAISGSKWERNHNLRELATVMPPSFGDDYSRFVSDAPLQLGLLNSDNRDQHTARSYEIPASGGLILAEDTDEHREIFNSDSNALFFKNREELFEKIDWVIKNPKKAGLIAENGYRHITQHPNTWTDRAEEILEIALGDVK